jgi:hypothetical protein
VAAEEESIAEKRFFSFRFFLTKVSSGEEKGRA